jgi:AhpD family alkylhydroperoxidase
MPTDTTPTRVEVDLLEANDSDFVAGFDRLYAQTWGDGAIPAKYKELTGVTLSVVIRCEPCLAYHIKRALAEKATKPEFVDAIRIGILSAGSATIPTARYGYRVLRELGVL